MDSLPKVANEGPISGSYIYAIDVDLKSYMYFPDVDHVPEGSIYAPGVGPVPSGYM